MQGGNLAPKVIRALDEGPSIGFTVGYNEADQQTRTE